MESNYNPKGRSMEKYNREEFEEVIVDIGRVT
ncbi:30S ribosomal protein S5, partial [Campylobacter lari]|nr:30S ribosomal protein S5 [Campylobacter lari]